MISLIKNEFSDKNDNENDNRNNYDEEIFKHDNDLPADLYNKIINSRYKEDFEEDNKYDHEETSDDENEIDEDEGYDANKAQK